MSGRLTGKRTIVTAAAQPKQGLTEGRWGFNQSKEVALRGAAFFIS
jgi:hypothetical protein